MKDRPSLQEESVRRRSVSLKKVSEVSEFLAKKPNGKSQSALKDELFLPQLANSLFAKASVDFLEKKSLEQLGTVATLCAACVDEFHSEGKRYLVRFQREANRTSIVTVIGDRPFIVNSIVECLEILGYKINVFLHPIILVDGYRTSLVYIEAELFSEAQCAVLQQHLENTLSDLLLATDDFTSMLVRSETLAKVLENPTYQTKFTQSEKREVADFLRWLTDGGYIFLGYSEWRVKDDEQLERKPQTVLGVFKSKHSYLPSLLEESKEDCLKASISNEPIYFSKLRTESFLHRRVRLNNMTIPEFSTDGRLVAWHSIVGILTSKALSQESSSIPLIRRKLQKIIELEEVVHNSHDYKYIVDIIDRMPKDQALRLDIESLREIVHTIISLQNKSETRVSVRFDSSRRGVSVLVVMPRERFNSYVRREIQQYIEAAFGVPAGSSEYHLDLGNKPLARFYFYVPLTSEHVPALDLLNFEGEINDISRTWEENLEERIASSGLFKSPSEIWFKYSEAFPDHYKALQSVDDCIADIQTIETLGSDRPIEVTISDASTAAPLHVSLAVYHLGGQISISKAFPVLENAGLEVISERSSCIAPFGLPAIFIHRFLVRPKSAVIINKKTTGEILAPGLSAILLGKAENDRLNSLLLDVELDIRAISLLRTYCALLWQVSNFATRLTILEAFSSEPNAALQFWNLFKIRFDPSIKMSIEERNLQLRSGLSAYMDILRDVSDINKDRILRALANLLEHTLRTNFFQNSATVALKIQSELVEIMPIPRPKYEIFISSPFMEGVHLRGAPVARGGIRWSDRNDDFRSEVLGLMKTQKIKNAVIVPSGAKGGFIVRNLPREPELVGRAVEDVYKQFIRSLLSITDNIVNGKVVHPANIVLHDGEDPYLVVAADKGTATFSDIANKIAVEEFDFWLGDAFASGGSRGYDHKKYGITAKGAWQSVKRHFYEIGLDYSNEPFTTVGIGDLAGDVFGNGMILSAKMKLLAAFNHRHIFLDPNPNPITSFEERQRLFRMPRSSWLDYNSAQISKGGGVFERFSKEIILSPEIREALSVASDISEAVNGETLITLILKAKVDLLWNGGIGTYVKSSIESHSQVNDGTNDRVRINANELRARVVAEGGNLGFTQKARIESAQNGVRINTDAIDNSAGVDLSDHEVNLKILCSDLIKKKLLTVETRDQMLAEVDSDVVDAVIQHNRNHALLLSIGARRSNKSKEYYRSLARFLHNAGYINRYLENLPDDEEFNDRVIKETGLCSPELAIFLAGVKMWIKDVLTDSPLCKDPRLQSFLLDYFPPEIQRRFSNEILQHKLAKSIIASQVANTLIDSVGITFVHRMCITHSTRPIMVIKCLLAAEMILRTKFLRQALETFDNFEQSSTYLMLRQGLGKTLRDATSWLISYHGQNQDLDELVKLYESPYQTLLKHADDLFVGAARDQYFERLLKYRTLKMDDFAARSLALAPTIIPVLEMLWASRKSNKNIRTVATIFSQILDCLGLNPIFHAYESIQTKSKWDHQLLLSAFEEIRRNISLLTCELIKKDVSEKSEVLERLKSSANFEELAATLEEVKNSPPSAAALSIVAKQLRTYQLP